MRFENQDTNVTPDELASIETELGIEFPESLKQLFFENNGGDPEPYVFESDILNTTVNETLPLLSSQGRGTAVNCYKSLVLEKAIVPKHLFPFAIDPGGDYFFVDCSGSGQVFYYRSDSIAGENLINLNLSLEDFWESLVEEI